MAEAIFSETVQLNSSEQPDKSVSITENTDASIESKTSAELSTNNAILDITSTDPNILPSSASIVAADSKPPTTTEKWLISELAGKNRHTLLQIEQQMHSFVLDNGVMHLDTGDVSSSYSRLVWHKLAERFNLGHQTVTSAFGKDVVVTKTSATRIPAQTLLQLADQHPELAEAQLSAHGIGANVKVMRRSQVRSAVQSNVVSADELSMQHRQAEYEALRAKIFNEQLAEATGATDEQRRNEAAVKTGEVLAKMSGGRRRTEDGQDRHLFDRQSYNKRSGRQKQIFYQQRNAQSYNPYLDPAFLQMQQAYGYFPDAASLAYAMQSYPQYYYASQQMYAQQFYPGPEYYQYPEATSSNASVAAIENGQSSLMNGFVPPPPQYLQQQQLFTGNNTAFSGHLTSVQSSDQNADNVSQMSTKFADPMVQLPYNNHTVSSNMPHSFPNVVDPSTTSHESLVGINSRQESKITPHQARRDRGNIGGENRSGQHGTQNDRQEPTGSIQSDFVISLDSTSFPPLFEQQEHLTESSTSTNSAIMNSSKPSFLSVISNPPTNSMQPGSDPITRERSDKATDDASVFQSSSSPKAAANHLDINSVTNLHLSFGLKGIRDKHIETINAADDSTETDTSNKQHEQIEVSPSRAVDDYHAVNAQTTPTSANQMALDTNYIDGTGDDANATNVTVQSSTSSGSTLAMPDTAAKSSSAGTQLPHTSTRPLSFLAAMGGHHTASSVVSVPSRNTAAIQSNDASTSSSAKFSPINHVKQSKSAADNDGFVEVVNKRKERKPKVQFPTCTRALLSSRSQANAPTRSVPNSSAQSQRFPNVSKSMQASVTLQSQPTHQNNIAANVPVSGGSSNTSSAQQSTTKWVNILKH